MTNAAMDMTLARGPIVAASKGMAVEANHQSLYVESHVGIHLASHKWPTALTVAPHRRSVASGISIPPSPV